MLHGVTSCGACLSSLRTFIQLDVVSEPHIEICLPNLPEVNDNGSSLIIPCASLSTALKPGEDPLTPIVPSADVIKKLEDVVKSFVGSCAGRGKSAMAICFLITSIVPELLWGDTKRGIKATVHSNGLPISVGLGSSASFSVALSAALLRLRHLMYGDVLPSDFPIEDIAGDDSPDGWSPPAIILNTLNGWAYAAEVIIQGDPSGLDNTTSCFGGAVRLNRTLGRFETLPLLPRMNMLLTITNIERDVKGLIARLAALHRSYPGVVKPIFESIESISQEFIKLIDGPHDSASEKAVGDSTQFFATMGDLLRMNHSLLQALNLVHPDISRVVELSYCNWGCPCKMTGSGGCAITLLKPNESDSGVSTSELKNLLKSEGYVSFQSVVGGVGVKWHGTFPTNLNCVAGAIIPHKKSHEKSAMRAKACKEESAVFSSTTLQQSLAFICIGILMLLPLSKFSTLVVGVVCVCVGCGLGELFSTILPH